ncbi:hypothetical protein MTO96_027580 [Rhipicephalus appendiculatus]
MGQGRRPQRLLLPWVLRPLVLFGSGELRYFVSRFERVRMQALNVPPTRSVDAMDVAADAQGGYGGSFMADGQPFYLSMAEDPGHVNSIISVFLHNRSGVSKVGTTTTSSNRPANFFLEKQNYDAVVYSGMEVMAPDCVTMKGGVRACFQNTTCAAIGPSKQLQLLSADAHLLMRMSAERIRSSSSSGTSSGLRVCGVELLADHSFFQSRNRNVNRVGQEMILHLHYADLVFRNTDFQLPFPRHCLVVGFSHRPFENKTLGISFVANPDLEGQVGGISELPMRFINQDTIESFNIPSIPSDDYGSPRVPAAELACLPKGNSDIDIMVKVSKYRAQYPAVRCSVDEEGGGSLWAISDLLPNVDTSARMTSTARH